MELINNIIKLKKVNVRLINESIIENEIHENITLEPDDIIEMKRVNSYLANGRPYAILVVPGAYSNITPEAREAVAKQNDTGVLAKALIIESLYHRILANFYVRFNKPSAKTRLFDNRTQAIEWLKQQLNKTP